MMILTKKGLEQITAVLGSSNPSVEWKYIAVGDGAGVEPDFSEDSTTLVNELYRSEITNISRNNTNSAWVEFEGYIPADAGAMYVREIAIFDSQNNMMAVSAYPTTFIPALGDGVAKSLYPKMTVQISNSENIEFIIDTTTVMASQLWAKEQFLSKFISKPRLSADTASQRVSIISDFETTDNFKGTHDISVFQAFGDEGYTNKIEEIVLREGDLTSCIFSNIPANEQVFVRVAVGSDKHLSDWGKIEFTPNSYVQKVDFEIDGSPNSVNPFAKVTVPTLPSVVGSNDTVDKLFFRVYRVSDNMQIGTTVETTNLTTPIVFQSEALELNTEYRFEIMAKSNELESQWSTAVATTTTSTTLSSGYHLHTEDNIYKDTEHTYIISPPATSILPAPHDGVSYEIDWGDGESDTISELSATHVYTSEGTKNIKITAIDSLGNRGDEESVNIVVELYIFDILRDNSALLYIPLDGTYEDVGGVYNANKIGNGSFTADNTAYETPDDSSVLSCLSVGGVEHDSDNWTVTFMLKYLSNDGEDMPFYAGGFVYMSGGDTYLYWNGNDDYVDNNTAFRPTEFSRLTIVSDGTIKVYGDDTLIADQGESVNINNVEMHFMGSYKGSTSDGDYNINGQIKNIRMFNRALTVEEINSLGDN